MDLEGELTAINHKTGEKCEITFHKNDGTNPSKIEGKAFNNLGEHCISLYGSWLNQISIITIETNSSEVLW